ncbi:hypothetical protein PHLCEN_2v8263 [Hermanssonia centrifuga]|uniref:Uncharacterized protein n=1 Tax=Hermanssonia centrifuga TaxID=98765 RepID=A0A2R6NU72_9APHY|nr:hypothetical protein PHLCEN_2v8263 [Hermanssonia centrifuga]
MSQGLPGLITRNKERKPGAAQESRVNRNCKSGQDIGNEELEEVSLGEVSSCAAQPSQSISANVIDARGPTGEDLVYLTVLHDLLALNRADDD